MRDKEFDFDKKKLGLSKKVSDSTKGKEAPVEDIASFGAEDYMKMLLDMIVKVNKDVYSFLRYKIEDSLLKMPYGWFSKCTYYNEDSYNRNQLVCARVYFRTFEERNRFEVFCINYSEQVEIEDKEYRGKNNVDNLNKAEEFVKKNLTSFGVLRNSLDESNLGLAKKTRNQAEGKDPIDNVSPDIQFEDPEAERVCHDHGVKTFADASQVKDISHWFYINRRIKRFTELKYFTGLHVIGKEAFFMAENLEAVELPNSVETIQESAFSNCDKLVSIDLPVSLVRIDKFAFYHSQGLKRVKFPEKMNILSFAAFDNCISLESVVLPRVYTIEKQLFLDCKSLKSVTFNDSIETIESKAFKGCESLKHVDLPDSIKGIDTYAFDDQVTFTVSSKCQLCQHMKEFYGDRVEVKLPKFNESNLGLSRKVTDKFKEKDPIDQVNFLDPDTFIKKFKEEFKKLPGFEDWKISQRKWDRWANQAEQTDLIKVDWVVFESPDNANRVIYLNVHRESMSFTLEELESDNYNGWSIALDLKDFKKLTYHNIMMSMEVIQEYALSDPTSWPWEHTIAQDKMFEGTSRFGLAKRVSKAHDTEDDGVSELNDLSMEDFKDLLLKRITPYKEEVESKGGKVTVDVNYDNPGLGCAFCVIIVTTVDGKLLSRHEVEFWKHGIWTCKVFNHLEGKDAENYPSGYTDVMSGDFVVDHLNFLVDKIRETTRWTHPEDFKIEELDESNLGLAKKSRQTYDSVEGKEIDMFGDTPLEFDEFKSLVIDMITSEKYIKGFKVTRNKFLLVKTLDHIPFYSKGIQSICFTQEKGDYSQFYTLDMSIATSEVRFTDSSSRGIYNSSKNPDQYCLPMTVKVAHEIIKFMYETTPDWAKEEYTTEEAVKIVVALNESASLGLAKKVNRDAESKDSVSSVDVEITKEEFADIVEKTINAASPIVEVTTRHEVEGSVNGPGIVIDFSYLSGHGDYDTWGRYRIYDDWWCMKLVGPFDVEYFYTSDINKGLGMANINNHLNPKFQMWPLTQNEAVSSSEWAIKWIKNRFKIDESSLGLAKKVSNDKEQKSEEDVIKEIEQEISPNDFCGGLRNSLRSIKEFPTHPDWDFYTTCSGPVYVRCQENFDDGWKTCACLQLASKEENTFKFWAGNANRNNVMLYGYFDPERPEKTDIHEEVSFKSTRSNIQGCTDFFIRFFESIKGLDDKKEVKYEFTLGNRTNESSLGLAKKVSSTPRKDIDDKIDELSSIGRVAFNDVIMKHVNHILSNLEKKGEYKNTVVYNDTYHKFGLPCMRVRIRIDKLNSNLVYSCLDLYEFDDYFFVDTWDGENGENYLINYGTLTDLFNTEKTEDILDRLKKEYTVGNALKAIKFFRYNSSILSKFGDDILDESVSSLGIAKKIRDKDSKKKAEDIVEDLGFYSRDKFIEIAENETIKALSENKLDGASLSEIYHQENRNGSLKSEINLQRGYGLNVFRIYFFDTYFVAEITGGSIGHYIMSNTKKDENDPEAWNLHSFSHKNLLMLIRFFLKNSDLVNKPKKTRRKKINESELGLVKKARAKAESRDVSDTVEELAIMTKDDFIATLDKTVKQEIVPEAVDNGYDPRITLENKSDSDDILYYRIAFNIAPERTKDENGKITKFYGGNYRFRFTTSKITGNDVFILSYQDWHMNTGFMEEHNSLEYELNVKNIEKAMKCIKKTSCVFTDGRVSESSLGLAKRSADKGQEKTADSIVNDFTVIDHEEFTNKIRDEILNMEIPTHPDWKVRFMKSDNAYKFLIDSEEDNIVASHFMCLIWFVKTDDFVFWVNNANRNGVLIYSYFNQDHPEDVNCHDANLRFKPTIANLRLCVEFVKKFFIENKGKDDKKKEEYWWPPKSTNESSNLGLAKKTSDKVKKTKDERAENMLEDMTIIGLDDFMKMFSDEVSAVKIANRPDLTIKPEFINSVNSPDTVIFNVNNGFSSFPGGQVHFYVDEDTGDIVGSSTVYKTDCRTFKTVDSATYCPEKDSMYPYFKLTYRHLEGCIKHIKRFLDIWSDCFPKSMNESRTALGLSKRITDKKQDQDPVKATEAIAQLPESEFLENLQARVHEITDKVNLECLRISTDTKRWMKVKADMYPLENPEQHGHIRVFLNYDDTASAIPNAVVKIKNAQILNVLLFKDFEKTWHLSSWSGIDRITNSTNAGQSSVYFDLKKDNLTSETYTNTTILSFRTLESLCRWIEDQLTDSIHSVSDWFEKKKENIFKIS